MLFERIPNFKQDAHGVFMFSVINSVDPKRNVEIDTFVAKSIKFPVRCVGLLQHIGAFGNSVFDNIRNLPGVCFMRCRKGCLISVHTALIGIINRLGCDNIVIGNNNLASVIDFKDH